MKCLLRTTIGAALGLALAGSANAASITYAFSGSAGGYACVACSGSDNTPFSGDFSLVVAADTTAVDTTGNPYFRLDSVDGTFTDGSFSATLTGVTLVANADPLFENIDFYNNTFDNGLGFTDPALSGYNLLSPIGPITASVANLTPTFLGGFFTTTTGEQVYLTSDQSLTFTATTPVPEPAAFGLVLGGLGIVGVVIKCRG
jgi:hypothetical protein